MPALSKSDLIRNCFAAYKTKHCAAIDALQADDFTFTSPYDDRIDRAECFVRVGRTANVSGRIFSNEFSSKATRPV